jgi:hypothetical protein
LTEQTAAPAPAPGVPAQPAARLGGAAPLERIVERLTEQTAARVASQRLDPPGEQLAPVMPATIVRRVRVAPQPAAPAAPLIEHAAEPIGAPVVPPGPAAGQPGALAEHVAAGRAPLLTPIQHIVERMRQHEVAIVAAPAPMPAERPCLPARGAQRIRPDLPWPYHLRRPFRLRSGGSKCAPRPRRLKLRAGLPRPC